VVEVVQDGQKEERLISLLKQIMNRDECKTLIFVETKRKADELTRWMRRDGWPTLCIHGDKTQGERDWVLNEFKTGKTPILLATDVAARGLDVDDIKYVINYDYPNSSEDYVHRIGRTGRSDKQGTSYTLFTYTNARQARDLIKVLQEANQTIPPALHEMAMSSRGSSSARARYSTGSYGGRGGGNMGRKREMDGGRGPSGGAKRGRFDDGARNGFGGNSSWNGGATTATSATNGSSIARW